MISLHVVIKIARFVFFVLFIGSVCALLAIDWNKSKNILPKLMAWHQQIASYEFNLGPRETVRVQFNDIPAEPVDSSISYFQSSQFCMCVYHANSNKLVEREEGLEFTRYEGTRSHSVEPRPTLNILGLPGYPRMAYILASPANGSLSWKSGFQAIDKDPVRLVLTVQRCQSTAMKDLLVGVSLLGYQELFWKGTMTVAVFSGMLLIATYLYEKKQRRQSRHWDQDSLA